MKLVVAGGGTGGHIFSGIAVAEEWKRAGDPVVFIGTPLGKEKDIVPRYGITLRFIRVGALKGKGFFRKMKTLMGLPQALWQSYRLLRQERPDAVLGIGGYASGPTLVVARMLRIFTAIIEQNIYPGLTNRILGRIVKKIFLSFAESNAFFPHGKTVFTGNPLRSEIVYSDYPRTDGKFCIFVFGGSQGARALDRCFVTAIRALPALWRILKVCHQVREEDLSEIKAFYEDCGIDATVQTFFDDMSRRYREAHLVVSRAGAGTVTELALSGRPAILVPYPHAADDHQRKNAEVLVRAHAALMIEERDLTPEVLAHRIQESVQDPSLLKMMAKNVACLARPHAAAEIKRVIQDHIVGRACV